MKKIKFSLIIGVLAMILAVGLNVRHALNGYGVANTTLNVEARERTVDEPATLMDYVCKYIGCCGGDDKCVEIKGSITLGGVEFIISGSLTFFMDK